MPRPASHAGDIAIVTGACNADEIAFVGRRARAGFVLTGHNVEE